MTLDDLFKIYWSGSDFVDGTDGIRRVVLALRDEMVATFRQGVTDDVFSETLLNACAVGMLDDILGGAVDAPVTIKETIVGTVLRMEAAGGTSREGVAPEGESPPCSTSAADPSQCEWVADGYSSLDGSMWVDCEGLRRWLKSRTACPSCGKPIKLKETAHD